MLIKHFIITVALGQKDPLESNQVSNQLYNMIHFYKPFYRDHVFYSLYISDTSPSIVGEVRLYPMRGFNWSSERGYLYGALAGIRCMGVGVERSYGWIRVLIWGMAQMWILG